MLSAEISEYEREREEKIRRNKLFLKELNIEAAAAAAQTPAAKHKEVKGLKKASPPKRQDHVPTRRSQRISGQEPQTYEGSRKHGLDIEDTPCKKTRVLGPEPMQPIFDDEEASKRFISTITSGSRPKHTLEKKKEMGKSSLGYLAKLRLEEQDVCKVTKERMFRILIHQPAGRELVFAADKMGTLGIWDTEAKEGDGQAEVMVYQPHNRPISSMVADHSDPVKIYTSSYDGSVVVTDLSSQQHTTVYVNEELMLTGMSMVCDGPTLYVGDEVGNLYTVDPRSSKNPSATFDLHDRKISCVHTHPSNPNLILTASLDRTACVWDVRNLKTKGRSKPLTTMTHGLSVSAAYFNPGQGNRVLTTSMDDTVKVWSGPYDTNSSPQCTVVRHDNQTGRWVTNFRAEWDPKETGLFIIGNMKRFADIYDAETGTLVQQLSSEHMTAIPAVNAFHPFKNEIVCASHGRCHIYRVK